MRLAGALLILALAGGTAAAARPAGAHWSVGHTRTSHPSAWNVRIHRGGHMTHGGWQLTSRFGQHRGQGRGRASRYAYGYGSEGYGWPSYGYGDDGIAVPTAREGFFADGDAWVRGHHVVYDYDRGYPYEFYRERPLRRR